MCDATFYHPAPKRDGQDVMVGHWLRPEEIQLDVNSGPHAVCLSIWDPANPSFARVWSCNAAHFYFTWNGLLYGNWGMDPTQTKTLQASDYYMRVEWRVIDAFWDGQFQFPTHNIAKDEPCLAILSPKYRFREENATYCYEDQVVSGHSLALELGWNGRPAPASILWQCPSGSIANPTESIATYTAGSLPPGTDNHVTVTVTADGQVCTRDLHVFGDHLGRDIENFEGGTNTHPLAWWAQNANCHGATQHAYDGSGTLYLAFSCPFSGCQHTRIYHRLADGTVDFDNVASCQKNRGYIISYVVGSNWAGNPSHSATLIGTGTDTWEVNGGVPSSNLFRKDVIHKNLFGGLELWILLHRPGP